MSSDLKTVIRFKWLPSSVLKPDYLLSLSYFSVPFPVVVSLLRVHPQSSMTFKINPVLGVVWSTQSQVWISTSFVPLMLPKPQSASLEDPPDSWLTLTYLPFSCLSHSYCVSRPEPVPLAFWTWEQIPGFTAVRLIWLLHWPRSLYPMATACQGLFFGF